MGEARTENAGSGPAVVGVIVASRERRKELTMNTGRLLLRLVVGGYFIGHGTQKLFGWFGGGGLNATASSFERLGLRPGKRNAIAAGVTETGGGAALVLGAATPIASAALIGTMMTAIRTVHFKNGPWLKNNGYEYNLVLLAAAVALAEVGPGKISADARLGLDTYGNGWAIAALAAGVGGAFGTEFLARRSPASAPVSTSTVEQ
jgi:putative oxidoreductase